MTSPHPTSSMEPSETTALNPTSSPRLQSRIAVRRAPDWLTKPTRPGFAIPAANVALKPLMGLMTPRQLGPTIRMPDSRARARIRRSSATPSGPISLNPAEMTMAEWIPSRAHSSMRSGTPGAGVTMTARSIGPGADARSGYALIPRMLGRFGLIGRTVPPNGLLMRFHRMVRPTLPAFSVAPTTATVPGEKNGSRELPPARRTSLARSRTRGTGADGDVSGSSVMGASCPAPSGRASYVAAAEPPPSAPGGRGPSIGLGAASGQCRPDRRRVAPVTSRRPASAGVARASRCGSGAPRCGVRAGRRASPGGRPVPRHRAGSRAAQRPAGRRGAEPHRAPRTLVSASARRPAGRPGTSERHASSPTIAGATVPLTSSG